MQSIFESTLDILRGFAVGEVWRIVLSVLVLLLVPVMLGMGRKHMSQKVGTMSERLERDVIWRNAIILGGIFALIAIWGSKIAGFAFSLAAVAGALLIVSKEALLNFLGFINLTISRPFGFGDYVEIGGAIGRVVDINAMTTTVLETRQGHQVTGSTVSIPNSLLLTQPVRNFTVTGEFVVNMLRIRLPRDADILAHEKIILESANSICDAWQIESNDHLSKMEILKNVDLPSADVRVIIELLDGRHADLSLRYSCRPNDRVKVEQDILRIYISAMHKLPKTNLNPDLGGDDQ